MAVVKRPDVIPASWVDDHRPVAEATTTLAQCEVRQPDVRVEDESDNSISWQPGELIIACGCRVQRLTQQRRPVTVGEQQISDADHLIVLPYSTDPIRPGDVIRIVSAKDALLVGPKFTVSAVTVGTHVWERDVYCTLAEEA